MEVSCFRQELVITKIDLKEFMKRVIDDCLNPNEGKVLLCWEKLTDWWNFMVFELLEQTIHIVCTDKCDDLEAQALKEDIKVYHEDMATFCENTRLDDFLNKFHGPRLIRTNVETFVAQVESKFKEDCEQYTLSKLKKISLELMKELIYPTGSFDLYKIRKGCVLVTWNVSKSTAEKLLRRESMGILNNFCTTHNLIYLKVIITDGQHKEFFSYSDKQSLPLSLYCCDLRKHYEIAQSYEHVAVPNKPMSITLANIDDEELLHYYQPDDFVKSTIRGDSSDIWHRKTPCSESDLTKTILSLENSELILIEGVPGSGKTFLCWRFCQQWTEGNLKTGSRPITLIVLHMRDEGVTEITNLTKLFAFTKPSDDVDDDLKSLVADTEKSQGEGLVFWLDGWDEVYYNLSSESLLRKLVSREYLPKSKVIVTSRPHGAKDILKTVHNRNRFEIVTSVRNSIAHAFDLQSEDDQTVLKAIKENPAIESALYTPLAASITRDVFKWCMSNDCAYPETLTELYTAYVYMLINDFNATLPVPSWGKAEKIISLDDADKKIKDLFLLAEEKRIVFPQDRLPEDYNERLIVPKIPLYRSGKDSYHFVHYSVQQFLEAYKIFYKYFKEPTKPFETDILINDQFTLVRRFFAGLSRLEAFNFEHLSKLYDFKHVLHLLFEAGSEVVKENIGRVVKLTHEKTEAQPQQKQNAGCSQDHKSDEEESGAVYLGSDFKWNSFDYYVAGFCIANSTCDWTLDFSYTSANEEEMEFFLKGLSRHIDQTGFIKHLYFEENDDILTSIILGQGLPKHYFCKLEHIDLSRNHFDHRVLANALPEIANLSSLSLWGARTSNQKKLHATEIIEALCNNSNLTNLELTYTFIGEDECEQLRSLLESSVSIKRLGISNNCLSSKSTTKIINGLSKNKSLEALAIGSFHDEYSGIFTPSTIEDVSRYLQSSNMCKLFSLDMCNCNLSPDSASTLATGIAVNLTLKKLVLSKNFIGNKGAAGFAKALRQNTVLEVLEFDSCKIESSGAVQLATALITNKTLKVLVLSNNKIGNSGITMFAQALKRNSSLETLWLQGDYTYSQLGVTKLFNSLKINLKVKVWLPDTILGETSGLTTDPPGIRRYKDFKGILIITAW